jgi:hypothetical protein
MSHFESNVDKQQAGDADEGEMWPGHGMHKERGVQQLPQTA